MKREFVSILKLLFPLLITLLLFSEIGENIWRTRGAYHARRFSYLFIAWAIYFYYVFRPKFNFDISRERFFIWMERFIFLIVAYFSLKTILNPLVIYSQKMILTQTLKGFSALNLIFSLFLVFRGHRLDEEFKVKIYLTMLLSYFCQKFITIIASPKPFIDVFTSNTQAVHYLLRGINPYGAKYIDIYGGRYDYAPGYVYWPGLLLFQVPAKAILGDIRYAFVISDLIALIGLYMLGNQLRLNKSYSLALCVLWFAFPVQNFILEQSWIDPLLVMPIIWMIFFLLKQNFFLAGLFLGFACATKQYGMMVALITGVWVFYHYGKENFMKITLSSLISFFPLMLPFLIWDFESFYQMSVKVPLSQDFRTDSFSIVAILWREFAIKPGPLLYSAMPFLGLLTSLFLIKKYQSQKFLGLLYSLVLFFSLIFFFGKQAFCNYYYFLAIFVLLSFFFEHFYLKTKSA